MDPQIMMATNNTVTQVEDEPLTWYLANTVVDTDTGKILQYKDLMQSREQKINRPLAK